MYQTEMKIEVVGFDEKKGSAKLEKFTLSDEPSKYVFEYDICHGLCKDGLDDKIKKRMAGIVHLLTLEVGICLVMAYTYLNGRDFVS